MMTVSQHTDGTDSEKINLQETRKLIIIFVLNSTHASISAYQSLFQTTCV